MAERTTATRADLLEVAVEAAHAAGALLLDAAGRLADGADLQVTTKANASDVVSEADRAAERLIAERVLAVRPDDGLLGEESQANRPGTSGLRWVVDPLDGTANFLLGAPQWSVSVACEDDAGPLVGVVHHPVAGETFRARRDGGADLLAGTRARRLQVTEVGGLDEVMLATGFAYDAAVRADWGRDLAALLGAIRDVRRAGSAALDLAWVAAGRVDAYLEVGLNPWDWAAGRLLVREAGGRVTEVSRTLGGHVLTGPVAGGATAHDALLDWLEEHP